MHKARFGAWAWVVAFVVFMTGCAGHSGSGDEDTGTGSWWLTTVKLTKLTLTPASPKPFVGTTTTLTATGTYSDKSTRDLTSTVTWASSNPAVATVDAAGVVKALGSGSAVISATSGTIIGKTTVAVQKTLQSITITPAAPTMVVTTTQTLTATGVYDTHATAKLSTGVTWQSSQPLVATVSSKGVVTAMSSGTTTITATTSASSPTPTSGSVVVTVSNATVTSITVSPSTKTLAAGSTQKYTATGVFSDNSKHALVAPFVTWSSTAPAVVTVDGAGLVTTTHSGTAQIKAKFTGNDVSGVGKLTVTGATLVSLAMHGCNERTLVAGSTYGCAAVGSYNDGTQVDVTSQLTWTSSSAAVGTILTGGDTPGAFTAVGAGSTTITGTDPISKKSVSFAASVSKLLVASLAFAGDNAFGLVGNPAAATVHVPDTADIRVNGFFNNGAPIGADVTRSLTWASSNPAVALVVDGPADTVTIHTLVAGSTTLTGTDAASGIKVTATLTVQPATLVSVAISPSSSTIALGTNLALVATGTFSDGSTRTMTSALTWSSDSGAVSVSNAAGSEGVLSGAGIGSASITARDPATGKSAVATISVSAARLVGLSLDADGSPIALGDTRTFKVTGAFSNGLTQDLTSFVQVSSSSPAIGVSGPHQITAYEHSGATITAREWATGLSATRSFTVSDPVLRDFQVEVGLRAYDAQYRRILPLGAPGALRALGGDTIGRNVDLTSRVTWSIGGPAAISNDACGLPMITSTALGDITVSATDPVSGLTHASNEAMMAGPALEKPVTLSLTVQDSVGAIVDSTSVDTLQVTFSSSLGGRYFSQFTSPGCSTGMHAVMPAGASSVDVYMDGVHRDRIVSPVHPQVDATISDAQADEALSITLAPLGRRFSVKDEAGHPVAGAHFAFAGTAYPGAALACSVGMQCYEAVGVSFDTSDGQPTTEADGTVWIPDVFATGLASVSVTPPPGAGLLSTNVSGDGDPMIVTLSRGAVVDIQVTGPGGIPLTGQNCPRIQAHDNDGVPVDLGNGYYRSSQRLSADAWSESGAFDFYDFEGCPGVPGMVDAFQLITSFSVQGDGSHSFALPIAPRTVTVTDRAGHPVEGALVELDSYGSNPTFGQQGYLYSHSAHSITGAPALTDASGKVTLDVTIGSPYAYTHVTPPAGLGLLPRSYNSVSGDDSPLTVVLEGARVFDVRVLDGQGRLQGDSATTSIVISEASGGTTTTLLPNATGLVQGVASTSATNVTINTDSGNRTVKGSLVAPGDIAEDWHLHDADVDVLVVDSRGQPVPNAFVQAFAYGAPSECPSASLASCTDSWTVWTYAGADGHATLHASAVRNVTLGAYVDDPRFNYASEWADFTTGHAIVTLPPSRCSADGCLACVAAPANLLSAWSLDGYGGDQVGGRNASYDANVTFQTSEVNSGLGVHDGQYLAAPADGLPFGNADRTLEAWARLDAVNPNGEAFFAGYGAFGEWTATFHIGALGDRAFISQWGDGIVGPSLPLGSWNHIAATSKNGIVALYVNGAKIGEQPMVLDTQAGSFYMGAIPNDPIRRLTGAVDEVAVYDRALSDAEIASIFAAGAGGKCH